MKSIILRLLGCLLSLGASAGLVDDPALAIGAAEDSVMARTRPRVSWHDPLCLANGGYWPQRVPVTFANGATNPLAGQPMEVRLPALAGARVEHRRPGG